MKEQIGELKNKTVLIAPLNWGLGHATRCIPVIRELLEQGAEVVIASDGDALTLLKLEFPLLQSILLPSYHIKYPKGRLMWFKMLMQVPGIFLTIYREHALLKKIVVAHHINIIISDNRYGLWHKKIKSVFITHQLNIMPPKGFNWLGTLMRKINFFYISRFDECWVPDHEQEPNLSGELSHHLDAPFKVKYTGPLSRFSAVLKKRDDEVEYDLLVILSGPEPQRSLFEQIVFSQLKKITGKVMVVRGTAIGNSEIKATANLSVVNHLHAAALEDVIRKSALVLCRSGYSSIMDLAVLEKRAILVPTPGQTEQEYLAEYFELKKACFSMKQENFNLPFAIAESVKYNGLAISRDNKLKDIIRSVIVY